jgi:hypothetical protein
MAVRELTASQSRARVAKLRRAGCRVERRTLPSGDVAVLKRCPPGVRPNPHPQAGAGEWYPASGGSEQPFVTRTGRRLQYVWQPRTGAHAYYDVDRDIILSDDEAMRALGTFSANPIGGAGTALIVGAVALVGYLLFAKRAEAKTAAVPATCAIDLQKLDRWGSARGFPVLYFPNATSPLTFEELDASPLSAQFQNLPDSTQVVVVIGDGSFWYYIGEGEQMGRADNLRADYCAFEG